MRDEFFHHRVFSGAHGWAEPTSGLLGSLGTPRAHGERASPSDPHMAPPCSFQSLSLHSECSPTPHTRPHPHFPWDGLTVTSEEAKPEGEDKNNPNASHFQIHHRTRGAASQAHRPQNGAHGRPWGLPTWARESICPVMGKERNSGVISISSQVFCTI